MRAQDLTDDEFARRGNVIFEERVRPHVDVEQDAHKFVAIDVKTGAYAVHEDEWKATRQLLKQQPDARGRIWYRRVGFSYTHRIGARSSGAGGEQS
jgi:hypothetical protein